MSTFEDAKIFESCELKFKELNKRDGGYYSSKHDEQVFQQVATEFGTTKKNVENKFHNHTKIAGDILVKKINNLPYKQREKEFRKQLSNIILNNKESPFEGEPSEELASHLDILKDEYGAMVEKMAEYGWTIPLTLGMEKFNEVYEIIDDEVKLDQYFERHYSKNNFKMMCKHIKNAITNPGQKVRFEESISIYEREMYSSCITVLFTVLEGMISQFGDDPKSVRMMRICNYNAEKESASNRKIKSLSWLSMYKYIEGVFRNSNFSETEPNQINRHWVLHGRTSKAGEKVDCLRVFNALSTIACIKKFE